MNTGKDHVKTERLNYLWTPDLDPLFWGLTRTGVGSAWYGHIPFAHWIVGALRPRLLVELGTRHGVSYSAWCEAVVRHRLETRCFAVDTWQGNGQSDDEGENVYRDLRRFHDPRYGAFSELLRCTFDEALPFVGDSSVDLLHIDGSDAYDAARHDFDRWSPKLSDQAVVLIHGTNRRAHASEVWRLWGELRGRFPSFEFLHGHGLGILTTGGSPAPELLELCSLRDAAKVHALRQRFSFLGERCLLRAQPPAQEQADTAECQARLRTLERELASRETRIKILEDEAATREGRLAAIQAEAANRAATERELRARAVERTARARADLAKANAGVVQTPALAGAAGSMRARVRVFYISGEPDTPGNFYRVMYHTAAMTAAGAEVSWIRVDGLPERAAHIAGTDLLVIWRAPWEPRLASTVEAARKAGARVIFDVDDLMIDPSLARLDVIDGIRTQGLTEQQLQGHYARLQSTMMAADYCIAPTEELATHLRRFERPTLVLPNGFDTETYLASRLAVRRRRAERADGLVRVGYAAGSRTHQRDFAVTAGAMARLLHDRPQCRLVLFRTIVDLDEFPAFQGLASRIEWRDPVPLRRLPDEIARFDVNIAPLVVGNVYCEAKSELKFFEAALADVPTIASPVGPYRRAIQDGMTGFLADGPESWYRTLIRLVDDPGLRRRIARSAHHAVLWRYGPLKRANAMLSALPLLCGDSPSATRAFAFELHCPPPRKVPGIHVPASEVAFESDRLGTAEVTVVVPLHNYAHYVEEALDSVREQTLAALDLVVVDDASTDRSLATAVDWAQRNAARFNRVAVLHNHTNAGLGPTRNAGIDAADTPLVFLLDADNRLLPPCCAVCLSAIRAGNAAYAYPQIRKFSGGSGVLGNHRFEPARFIGGNFIDAMALVSKEAWAAVEGYADLRIGWEDFDFWCRLVERGLFGCPAGEVPLAEYRVHGNSMLSTITMRNASRVISLLEERHPWLNIVFPQRTTEPDFEPGTSTSSRLDRLLPTLRCPETGERLVLGPDGVLRTNNGRRTWPLIAGRPNLFPGLAAPEMLPDSHVSNPLPENALTLIQDAHGGLVLNLSAGATHKRFENVVEAEAAVFRHTDILADAHNLPFVDNAFEAVIVMNAFEHYRDPKRVVQELLRVLRPGGKVLIHTAFLQPLHAEPWHFYNCTRYGLEKWFEDFETLALHVPDNFHPGYSISWLAAECESALRRNVSAATADAFKNLPMHRVIAFWRGDVKTRSTDELWSALAQLPQAAQESIAAGFEYFGRKPLN